MAAALADALENVDAVALNAASAELGGVFAPALRASTAAGLTGVGVELGTPAGQALLEKRTGETVAAFRWAMEPGDPLYAALDYPLSRPVLVQVIAATTDAPLHAAQGQRALAQAFGRAPLAQTTFTLAECDSPSSAVGSLLQPCVAQKTSPRYPAALLQTAGLQRQLVTFVVTSIAGAPLVCSPDFSVACP
jgi:hypothetical protein